MQNLLLATYAEQVATMPTRADADRRLGMLVQILARAFDNETEFAEAVRVLVRAADSRREAS